MSEGGRLLNARQSIITLTIPYYDIWLMPFQRLCLVLYRQIRARVSMKILPVRRCPFCTVLFLLFLLFFVELG